MSRPRLKQQSNLSLTVELQGRDAEALLKAHCGSGWRLILLAENEDTQGSHEVLAHFNRDEVHLQGSGELEFVARHSER